MNKPQAWLGPGGKPTNRKKSWVERKKFSSDRRGLDDQYPIQYTLGSTKQIDLGNSG